MTLPPGGLWSREARPWRWAPILEVKQIHTYYGESHILRGIDITVPPGTAAVVVGRNGAGKTTLVRSIIGLAPPRLGAIRYKGRDIHRMPPYDIARLGIGLVPQGRRVFPSLSVTENLTVGARPGGDWTLHRVFALFPKLKERHRHRGRQLSGGEQQMLAIGRALMGNPSLLLLDEPSEGLAPMLVRELGRVLQTLKSQGLSLLLVEQSLPMAMAVAERVHVLSRGELVYEGTPNELEKEVEVKARYLGV